METVQRTAYSAHLQTCKLLDKPFTVVPNSTLNQKFNLFASQVPATNEYPKLGYIGIGNKGTTYELVAGNFLLTTSIPHLSRHAANYNFIPFVVRPVANDISAEERLKYRLRVPTTIGGQQYIVYYLRTLNLNNVIPTIELRNVNDGVITNTPFIPDLSDLLPVHPVLSNPDLNNPNGDYLVSTAKITFLLNQADITNIMEACEIIYGDPRYAVINEICLVTGVDKIQSGVFGGTTSNYTDVIAAQVAAFISQNHILTDSTAEIEIGLNVGSVEPLAI
jgi:hypothetical protein